MSDLTGLKNIGEWSAGWLAVVGIETVDDLERIGPLDCLRRVKRAFPDETTLVLLYALQGTLLDLPWTELPDDLKRRLVAAVRSLERNGEAFAVEEVSGATQR